MSGTLAIAAVSAVIKYLLLTSLSETNVATSVGDVRISAIAPDKVPADINSINVFFFRSTINPGWAQNALPARDTNGTPISRPYLALDLYYLITAHADKDFYAEILLGYAMQIFHEQPVLPRQLIRDALVSPVLETADTPAPMLAAIAAANLAEQVEQIKFSPEQLSIEALSQIWSTLQTQYRPTAVYKATVVLLESRAQAQSALPVRGYNVYPLPFRQPIISDVIAADGPGTPILISKDVRVRGSRLRGDDTRVRVAGIELSGSDISVSDNEISFALPTVARAGIGSVQIAHYLAMGTPPIPHRGIESNVAAFILQPQIQETDGNYAIEIIAPVDETPRLLRVQLEPVVDASQRVTLLLNEYDPPSDRPARAYAVDALLRDPASPPTAQVDFPIPDVANGEYLVRVRVDGAESPLQYTAPQGYDQPRIAIA